MVKSKKKPILKFQLQGKGIWLDTKGLKCEVYDFDIIVLKKGYGRLKVSHNLPWGIYTDETFEKQITKLFKKKHPELKIDSVTFSEQGLQKDFEADMDIVLKT